MAEEKKEQQPIAIEMQEVTGSSQVTHIGYDHETHTLGARFSNGAEYQYSNVPGVLYQKLCEAESLGSFMHKHIKGKYAHRMVTPPTPKAKGNDGKPTANETTV